MLAKFELGNILGFFSEAPTGPNALNIGLLELAILELLAKSLDDSLAEFQVCTLLGLLTEDPNSIRLIMPFFHIRQSLHYMR